LNEQVYYHLFNHTAVHAGFEVRFANSWNSYDWLSNHTIANITKAMQNSKVDERIHNILKLALLMENGGMLINQIDIVLLGDDFDWVHELFEYEGQDFEEKFVCNPKRSFVFMSRSPPEFIDVRY